MLEFVLFCVPAAIYLVVQWRKSDGGFGRARERLGLRWGSPRAYAWAAVLFVPLLAAGWLALVLIPPAAIDAPGVSIAHITSVAAAIAVVLRAFGEEVFFRGLLGGILVRRLGFAWGNVLQATLFVVPHLALLLVDLRTWPILLVQLAAGWLLGWLRTRTGTFVPGAFVHAASNLLAAFLIG